MKTAFRKSFARDLKRIKDRDVLDRIRGTIEQAEKALREKFSTPDYQGAHIAVLMGEPAHGIADYAQEKKAELIVIPSHGRTGITRLLIGSVAERVVRLAHCPVLVLRK